MFRPHLKIAKQLYVQRETWTLHTFRYESRLFFVRGWCFSSHFIHFLFTQELEGGSSDTWHLTNPQYFTNRSPHDGNPIEATIHPTYSISITQYIFAQNIQVISFWGKCNPFIQVKRREETFIKKMIVTGAFVSILIYLQLWHLKKNSRNPLFVTFNLISFSVLCSRGISVF